MEFHDFYGGYQRLGNYTNVVLGGSPSSTLSRFGTPLTIAHNSGYGKGIGFENNGNDVKMVLDLIGFSASDVGQYVPNGGSYVGNDPYDWLLEIAVSKDGGKNYSRIFKEIVFRHNPRFTMIYIQKGATGGSGQTYQFSWTELAKNSQWAKNFTLENGVTHVRFSLAGDREAFPSEIIFPISVLIPDYTPMAIRKNGSFKSLDNYGTIRIRRKSGFVILPKTNISDSGKPNVSSARIRKNNIMIAQKKVGN